MQQNLNKPSKELLLELINLSNSTNFTMADLDFAVPEAAADDAPANTKMTVTATETNAFQGIKVFHYNRLDLGLMFNGLRLQVPDSDSITTVMDVVAILNQRYQLGLSTDDVIDGPVNKDSDGTTVVRINTKPESFAYQGTVSWTLVGEPDESSKIYDGFFLINLNQAMFSPDLAAVNVVTDPQMPDMSHPLGPDYDGITHVSFATGGFENELFVIVNHPAIGDMANSSTKVYVTKDNGATSVVAEALGQTVAEAPGVVLNGCAYYVGYDTVEDGDRVYRVAPDGAGGYQIDTVFELTGWFAAMEVGADGVLYLTDGEYLHYTTDGVNWTREALPAEFGMESIVWHKGRLVGTGFDAAGANIWERTGPGQYTITASPLATIYPGIADSSLWFDSILPISLDDDKLLFKININMGSEYNYADMVRADDIAGPWTRTNTGSGVVSYYPPVYNGSRVGVLGDNFTGKPYWAIYSDDKGATWSGYQPDIDNPFNEPPSPNRDTFALGLYRIMGTTPPIVPVVPVGQASVAAKPNYSQGQVTHIVAEPTTGGFVVSGHALTEVNGNSFGAETERVDSIAAMLPSGHPDWFRNQTLLDNVFAFARLPDGGFLVTGNLNGSSDEVDEGFQQRAIYKLNQDFTHDPSWVMVEAFDENSFPAVVAQMHVYADGKILVAGGSNTVGGEARPGIFRLNADGSLDSSFGTAYLADTNTYVNILHVTPSGKIFTSGPGTTPLGSGRPLMLDANGAFVTGFPDLGQGAQIYAVHEFASGDVVVFGSFVGVPYSCFKMLADGTRDVSWTGPSVEVRSVFEQTPTQLKLYTYGIDGYTPQLMMNEDGSTTPYTGYMQFNSAPVKSITLNQTGEFVSIGDFSEIRHKAYPMAGAMNRAGIVRWHEGVPGVSPYNPNAFVIRHNVNLSHPFKITEGSIGFDNYDQRFFSSAANEHVGVAMRLVRTSSEYAPVDSAAGEFSLDGDWLLQLAVGTRHVELKDGPPITLEITDSLGTVYGFNLIYDVGTISYRLSNTTANAPTINFKAQASDNKAVTFEIPFGSIEGVASGDATFDVKINEVSQLVVGYIAPEPTGGDFMVDMTKARVYDNDQTGDGFLTTDISATTSTLSVTNTNAGVNAFFDPYQIGPAAGSFFAEWTYDSHYLYNANLYLTTEGKGDYSPDIPNVFWVPGSSLYIEQTMRPKSVNPLFIQAVNVYHLNRLDNPSQDGALNQICWYQSAQPTDLPGGTVRTHVDLIFDGGDGGHVLCTRHYLNGYLAGAYVWCSNLDAPTSNDRLPLGNYATIVMNTNGDSQPYAVSGLKFGPPTENDPNFEVIEFNLGDLATGTNSGILNFTINAGDKIVAVATASEGGISGEADGGDVDIFVNLQSSAPGDFNAYALKGEHGFRRECLNVRDNTRTSTVDGVYNLVVNAYTSSKNVRVRIIKVKV